MGIPSFWNHLHFSSYLVSCERMLLYLLGDADATQFLGPQRHHQLALRQLHFRLLDLQRKKRLRCLLMWLFLCTLSSLCCLFLLLSNHRICPTQSILA